MKYIRDISDNIYIFPMNITHADFALRMGIKAKSAGIFVADINDVIITGGSDTLNLRSLPDDRTLLMKQY